MYGLGTYSFTVVLFRSPFLISCDRKFTCNFVFLFTIQTLPKTRLNGTQRGLRNSSADYNIKTGKNKYFININEIGRIGFGLLQIFSRYCENSKYEKNHLH